MKKSLTYLLLAALTISALPAVSLADSTSTASTSLKDKKGELRDKLRDDRQEKRDITKEIKDDLRAIKAVKKEQIVNRAKNSAERYIAAVSEKLTRSIKRLENIITRLEGPNSVIAKLEANGKNTTAIKAKLTEAKDSLADARTELASSTQKAKDLIENASSTSTTSSKVRIAHSTLKTVYKDINSKIRLAHLKIKEAVKLIREIPGVGKINSNATTTATSSTSN